MKALKILSILVVLGLVLGGGYMLFFGSASLADAPPPEVREIVLVPDEPEPPPRKPKLVARQDFSLDPIEEDVEILEELVSTTTELVEEEETETVEETSEVVVKSIVVGTNRVSDAPQVGSLFACETVGEKENNEADRVWVREGLSYTDERPVISGKVSHKNVTFNVSVGGSDRTITGNSLPKHLTGTFPVTGDDYASRFVNESFEIMRKDYEWVLPSSPAKQEEAFCIPEGIVGVALTGSFIKSAIGEEHTDAGAFEVFDRCGGQVDKDGYHYHGETGCITNYAKEIRSDMIGYALDGFGIYSSVENGVKITNSDLDSCHGHEHEVSWDEELVSMYHYHATDEFPYTVGCFVGEPIAL